MKKKLGLWPVSVVLFAFCLMTPTRLLAEFEPSENALLVQDLKKDYFLMEDPGWKPLKVYYSKCEGYTESRSKCVDEELAGAQILCENHWKSLGKSSYQKHACISECVHNHNIEITIRKPNNLRYPSDFTCSTSAPVEEIPSISKKALMGVDSE